MISGAFLQSPQWAEFQKTLDRKVFFINEALIIKMPLVFGFSYLYSPKGATSDLDEIKKLAKKERAIFFRCEPQQKPNTKFIQTKDIQPRCTQILDLTKSEQKLLAGMKQKTRYNIRLAEKKGVKIDIGNFEKFYNLLIHTSTRQKIKLHPKNYYKKLAGFNEIFIAYYQNKPIAGAMVNFFEDTATYLHGGSLQKLKNGKTEEQKNIKNLMAPYLLHWEIIKTAKSRGIKYYDWWGVDEKRWPGITRFKKGFGGREICAPGTYDLPIDKFWYFWYKLIRR